MMMEGQDRQQLLTDSELLGWDSFEVQWPDDDETATGCWTEEEKYTVDAKSN
jgi:hypothetical protein